MCELLLKIKFSHSGLKELLSYIAIAGSSTVMALISMVIVSSPLYYSNSGMVHKWLKATDGNAAAVRVSLRLQKGI